ncbi:MAG: bifunctional 3-(3-hydroxy-phenyl)propionate/3-hydroxycinnamic acid hydroxylase [Deltaproteobacteria bacterium]|nr:bifunctional 3-(3-hydroxy-phenyl)propionate/3-hydroxycinnamic acid hydroxylase [Deltaproteobacteria bacterium]MBW2445213.1 bifunctional 3-(3-hydroxy-phenyl)propionate/3-hydroxycinnamic acid hydroxylase [Deltaproteobacteria bacterium]
MAHANAPTSSQRKASGAPEFDVAVIGYGPVGAGAAILLADAGLRVVVLERTTEVMDIPRAVGLDGEVVRAFQGIGRAERVDAVLQPRREKDAIAFTDSKRKPYFGMELSPFCVNGWRDIAFFDQPEFEGVLRELVDESERADVRLGCEVTALEQHEDRVVIGATDLASGVASEVSASYVIGCDGAASFVRNSLGIGWESLGYDQDWLVVDVTIRPEADLPILSMQVCDPARITTYICGKDPNRRWEFKLLPGESREEVVQPERVQEMLADWLPAEHYTLRRAAVYQFHAATAERWHEGRVFLAGDAAHQTPPFLGQGLNAGFRDVINLAWKLPRVLDGSSDESLLETYAQERDGHARDLVEWAVAVGKLMEVLAATEAGEAPEGPSEDLQRSGYGQGRTVPPLRGGVVIEEQVGEGRWTGNLFAQPTVETPDGEQVMLDELLGSGFAVVGRAASDVAVPPASRAFLKSIGASTVSLAELKLQHGKFDSLFESHAVAIVRPDRYVFGVTDDEHSLEDLLARLEGKLALASS